MGQTEYMGADYIPVYFFSFKWWLWSYVSVKNKILYRQACHMQIQAAVRGWLTRLEYRPRIRGLGRIHKLHDQIAPMQAIVEQLKKDKDSAKKKVAALLKSLEEAITQIQVQTCGIKWFLSLLICRLFIYIVCIGVDK